jgi:hypothetical protein
MLLSKQVDSLAQGIAWNDRTLKDAMNTGVLSPDDVAILAMALQGVANFHAIQDVAIKLHKAGL